MRSSNFVQCFIHGTRQFGEQTGCFITHVVYIYDTTAYELGSFICLSSDHQGRSVTRCDALYYSQVMETPQRLTPRAILSATGSDGSVWSKAATITNWGRGRAR